MGGYIICEIRNPNHNYEVGSEQIQTRRRLYYTKMKPKQMPPFPSDSFPSIPIFQSSHTSLTPFLLPLPRPPTPLRNRYPLRNPTSPSPTRNFHLRPRLALSLPSIFAQWSQSFRVSFSFSRIRSTRRVSAVESHSLGPSSSLRSASRGCSDCSGCGCGCGIDDGGRGSRNP